MDWKSFIASLVSSLAWPVVIGGVLLAFRKQLVDLLPLLRLKHGDTEVGFLFAKAEESVAEIKATTPAAAEAAPPATNSDKFIRLLGVSPRAAVLVEKRELEDIVINRAKEELGETAGDDLTFGAAINVLRNKDVADPVLYELLEQLRQLGNAAIHAKQVPTESEALQYRKLAEQAKKFLRYF